MQKATETGWDSLVKVCYEIRKVVGEFSLKESMVDEIKVDFYAQQIVPSQELEEYVLLNSTGDGSCLYRSISLLVAGNELKYVELRVRCVIELALHSTYYLADEELVEQIAAQERLLGVKGNDSGLVDADFVHEIYKTKVMKTCQLFEYASMFQIQALGAVLRRKIRSIYPETTPEVMYRSNRSFNMPPPRAYPGHLTPLPSQGGGNLIIRVFQGVGNLIPML